MTDAVNTAAQNDGQQNAADNAPMFTLEKVYVKDISLENPSAPESFLEQQQPQIEVQLMHQAKVVADGVFDASITATVTAKAGDKVLFLVEATQAGIFQVRNIPEEVLPSLVGIQCPTILFPYLRETVSDAIGRAGYQPVFLAPINFEAWYNDQVQQQEAEAAAQQSSAKASDGPSMA